MDERSPARRMGQRNGIYRFASIDNQGRYHSAILPGLWLQVDWLWQTPLPPLLSILKAWKLV